MPKNIKAYNIDTINERKLNEISNQTKVNKSKLVRMFISYFYKHKEELRNLIKGDYDEQ